MCSQGDHRGHECCDLEKQAEICRAKLEQLWKDTDGLIEIVKKAIDKIKCQEKQAEADIDDACDYVTSTFRIMHEKLNQEEKRMLANLHNVCIRKTIDIALDSQMMTQASVESLKSFQVKLADKNSAYDISTVTDSIQRDVENHFSNELTGVIWKSQNVRKNLTGVLRYQGKVDLVESVMIETIEVTGSMASEKQLNGKEVSRIRLHAQSKDVVQGMVVYNQRVYVVYSTGLIVYCYAPDGSPSHTYEHESWTGAVVTGMCLMVDGDTAMLVVCDISNKTLVWISISDDVTMDQHHTQHVNYCPWGAYNDRGDLMVCDPINHKIHRYRHHGQTLSVIKLPNDVKPYWVTRHGDGGDQYVVSEWDNKQVVLIDGRGQVKTRYKGDILSVKLGRTSEVMTDPNRGVLIADYRNNQVLLLRRTGDVVKILDQNVTSPFTLYLDTDHHRLYVSSKDQHKVH